MKAVQLTGFSGIEDLEVVELARPVPQPQEILIRVEAAGINFAELEMVKGRYPSGKTPPFVMGFEAAGTVVEAGSQVNSIKVGDRVTAIVSSGGFAEFAIADASRAISVPEGVSAAEATTIPIQGLTAYALLKFVAKPHVDESLLIQAAAGGVGLYLVQLAKHMGGRKVIALAGSKEKCDLVRQLGTDVAIDYGQRDWVEQVKEATGGKGVDVLLEAAAGEIGKESFKLVAPFGRIVLFGARNIHEAFETERIRQLVYKNQSVVGFNLPTMQPELLGECVAGLLKLVAEHKLKMFANNSFPLDQVRAAFQALAGRQTIGKVVLVP